MNKPETTGAVRPKASPAAKPAPQRPSWAIGEANWWNGRTLWDISWHDAMALPGITKAIARDIDEAAESRWALGVEPATRRFLDKHGIDRVRPL